MSSPARTSGISIGALWALRALLALCALVCASPANAQYYPGVLAQYWNYAGGASPAMPATTPDLTRPETAPINYVGNTAARAVGIGPNRYITRWSGRLLIPATGKFTFYATAEDGVRVYIDCNSNGTFAGSNLLIDQWADRASPASFSGSCPNNISAGSYINFYFDTYNNTGPSWTAVFQWSGPGIGATATTVPVGTTGGMYTTTPTDITPPSLTSATNMSCANTQLALLFSEALDPVSASLASNYAVSQAATTVSSALLDSAGTTVFLNLSAPLTSAATVTASNIKDLAGNTATAQVSAAMAPVVGVLSSGALGVYYSQNGVAGAFLTGASVTRKDSQINFDFASGSPSAPTLGVDNYSIRWSGYLLAPSTGLYTFRTVSDDGVRLSVNGMSLIDNWADHVATTDTSATIYLVAGRYYPYTLDYFDHTGVASVNLQWLTPGAGSYALIPSANYYYCASLGSLTVSGSASASTCAPTPLTVSAFDQAGVAFAAVGQINMSASLAHGTWSDPGPGASGFVAGASDSGLASFVFNATHSGVKTLNFANTHADNPIRVFATDASTSIQGYTDVAFSDNAMVITSVDSLGSVAIAGRAHQMRAEMWTKAPSAAMCAINTSYTGSKPLDAWLTLSGAHPAPALLPAVAASASAAKACLSPSAALGASAPALSALSNTLSLSFSAGAASFWVCPADVGQYSVNLRDDTRAFAAGYDISGIGPLLTARPYALAIRSIASGATANPGGTASAGSGFVSAQTGFTGALAAVQWASGQDGATEGSPSDSASLAGNPLTPAYAGAATLNIASFTPSGGVAGTLSGASVASASFSGGSAALALSYSEAGSLRIRPSAAAYLGVASVPGQLSAEIGRFFPASFGPSAMSSANACATGSFTYMGQPALSLSGQLTARGASSGALTNYDASRGYLFTAPVSVVAVNALDGVARGSRLALGASAPAWSAGVWTLSAPAASFAKASPRDGPFESLQFGLSALDPDGARISAMDMAQSVAGACSGAGCNAKALGAPLRVRHGKLLMQSAYGAASASSLRLPLAAYYWASPGVVPGARDWVLNTSDSCTSIPQSAVSFGALQGISSASAGGSAALSAGVGALLVNRLPAGASGKADVAINLGATTAPASCVSGMSASVGSNRSWLRESQCAPSDQDPGARATWSGANPKSDRIIFSREMY